MIAFEKQVIMSKRNNYSSLRNLLLKPVTALSIFFATSGGPCGLPGPTIPNVGDFQDIAEVVDESIDDTPRVFEDRYYANQSGFVDRLDSPFVSKEEFPEILQFAGGKDVIQDGSDLNVVWPYGLKYVFIDGFNLDKSHKERNITRAELVLHKTLLQDNRTMYVSLGILTTPWDEDTLTREDPGNVNVYGPEGELPQYIITQPSDDLVPKTRIDLLKQYGGKRVIDRLYEDENFGILLIPSTNHPEGGSIRTYFSSRTGAGPYIEIESTNVTNF